MSKARIYLVFLGPVVVFSMLLAPLAVRAQDASGRIIGNVVDAQGAAIAGARIAVTNVATEVSRETTTGVDGTYQVLQLPIGDYRVTAEHPGFRKTVTEPQTLSINQSLRVDIKMEVGAVTETVQVEAASSTVETVVATIGQTVASRPIVNMPLNGRNVLDLALLQPGVIESNQVSPSSPNPSNGTYTVAGGRSDSITYLLDGGINNNLLSNTVVLNPNPDTIAEFRILESNYSAEYGRNGGGIISVVTKSGTNSLHGSAFDFVRNDAFNANTFFNNEQNLPKPILKRNQFGVTVGGPVVIPGVVNGRDRFFFFSGYQGQRLVQTILNPAVVTYTPEELRGDFSRSNSTRTGPDPGVASFLQKFPFFQPNPALAAQAIIDPNRINKIAKNYISNNLIPTSPSGRIFPQGGGKNDHDELTNKVDFLVTQNDRISATLGARRNPSLNPFSAEANVTGYPTTTTNHRYFGNITYTKVFSPTLLNEFRFTAQRNNNFQAVPAVKLPKAADLGVGITPDNPTGPPSLRFASGLRTGFNRQGPTDLIDNTYAWTDNLSWTKGRHTMRYGFYFSPYQNNTVFDFYINGLFFFSGTAASGGIGSGNDRADFLLGLPDEFLQFGEAPSNIRSRNYAAFAQDEWHVTRNLVLSLGVRYEYSDPKIDTQGRSFSLQLGAQSQRFINAPKGLLFPGDPGAPKGANFPDKNDWAPRFGFAWDPRGNGKTSLRGGFGVFYDILKGEDNLQFNGQAPFFGFADLYFDPLKTNPTTDVPYFSDPFPSAGIPNSFPSRPPARDIDFAKAGFLPFGGGGVYFVNPHLRTPYIYQYNLSLQHELVRNLSLELGYIGNSGHKLTSLMDVSPFILGTTTRIFNAQPGVAPASFSYLYSFENVANQNYNGLQASLQKRISNVRFLGTTYLTFAYTHGHALDNASGFREVNSVVPFYNHHQFYSSSDFDVRHRLVFSGGWDLPFDKAWQGGPKRLTQGWSLYPIVTYRTGFPDDFGAGISNSRTRTGPSAAGDANLVRPDQLIAQVTFFDPKLVQTFSGRSGHFYFDPTNFSVARFSAPGFDPVHNPSQRTYGSVGRNSLRGPGRTNFDLALAKTTNIFAERVKTEFRAEFFNILNHTEFYDPSTVITRGTFGQITQTWDPRIIQLALRLTF